MKKLSEIAAQDMADTLKEMENELSSLSHERICLQVIMGQLEEIGEDMPTWSTSRQRVERRNLGQLFRQADGHLEVSRLNIEQTQCALSYLKLEETKREDVSWTAGEGSLEYNNVKSKTDPAND